MSAKTVFTVGSATASNFLHGGQNFLLLNSDDPLEAVTYPGGFQTITREDAQKWQLMKYKGTGSPLGQARSQWATEGTEALVSGDIVSWYNPANSKAYDCAGSPCSKQPFPPPAGHTGTPFRVYKVGGSAQAATGCFIAYRGREWCMRFLLQPLVALIP